MAMTINTNVVSLNSQRNLSLSGGSLATSMQRLSSGLRVNSAKDDAAGLAISERMNAQAKGLAVAARNANDGISLAQTAEGAMGKVGDMLQRMRELAVQSSNATNSKTDRAALQAEVTQLTAEIDRVAKTSSFNGTKLLNGSFAGAVFQVGASAGDNITVGGIANMKTDALGKAASASSAASGALVMPAGGFVAATGLTLQATGVNAAAVALGDVAAASSIEERVGQMVALINAKSAETGVTAFASDDGKTYTFNSTAKADGTAVASVVIAGGGAATTGFAPGTVALTASTGALDKLDVKTQTGAWKAIQQIEGVG